MLTCCVIGHRRIEPSKDLHYIVEKKIIDLIVKGVTVFLFGSRSEFTDFCYDIVTDLQKTYPKIVRVYVRAEYPIISEQYDKYLKQFHEESYYYDANFKTGRLSYIKRNEHIIDNSDYCLFYYNDAYQPITKTKSGTMLAYNYALKKKKVIYNFFIKD